MGKVFKIGLAVVAVLLFGDVDLVELAVLAG